MDRLIEEGLGLWGARGVIFRELPSTNGWLLDRAAEFRHGDVVRALYQSAGYGRFQRSWTAPPGESVAISVLLEAACIPTIPPAAFCQLAALAVRELLESRGIPAALKWPNDVLTREKKISGILAESSGEADRVVLGIGLNVNISKEELSGAGLLNTATSMRMETSSPCDVASVCAELIHCLERTFDAAARSPAFLFETWPLHDALTGRPVTVHVPNGPLVGMACGIDDEGRLLLTLEDGRTLHLSSGDATLTGPAPGLPPLRQP